MGELRAAVQARLSDASLGVMLDEWVAHYDKLFQLKAGVARADPIHLLDGAWRTPAERCFLWISGFRPSELLKVKYIHIYYRPFQKLNYYYYY